MLKTAQPVAMRLAMRRDSIQIPSLPGALTLMLAVLASCVTSTSRAGETSGPWTIVLSSQASPSEKHAADELRQFLSRASGFELNVVKENDTRADQPGRIFIAFGDRANQALARTKAVVPMAFGEEAFLLRTIPNQPGEPTDLVIAGGRKRGTMYGVYTFLDRLGVRFFTPRITKLPPKPITALPHFDERGEPAFLYREPYIREATDKDWCARNRVNSWYANLDAQRGGKQGVLGVHTFEMLIPRSLYETHPEYFPLIGGKRVTGYVQRCLTNPDVADVAVASLVRWMDQHPDVTYFAVVQNDTEKLCECPDCQAVIAREGAPSGLYLEFVNTLAERVEKSHPGKYLCTQAYRFTETPPRKVKPRPNVFVQLCPIDICLAHPLDECVDATPTRFYGDLVGWSDMTSARFYEHLNAWSKLTNQLFVWHYDTDFLHLLMPFPDFRQAAANLKIYKSHGVRGVFMQGSCDAVAGSDSDLRAWVLARLLWEPDQDYNPLVDEWMQGVYGQAWKPMRRLFDLVQQRTAAPDAHLHLYDPVTHEMWPDDTIRKMRQCIKEALALAGDDAQAIYYIRKNSLPVVYLDYILHTGSHEIKDGIYQPMGGMVTKEDYDQLVDLADEFDMKVMRENAFDITLRTLLRQRVASFAVVTLENDHLRMDVVPDLGGRIIRLIHKATGTDLMHTMDAQDNFYPNCGGYEESTTRTWGSTGFANRYTAAIDGDTLTLASEPSRGVKFTRSITLAKDGAGLSIHSTLTNVRDKPISTQLLSRMNLRSRSKLPSLYAAQANGTQAVPDPTEIQGDATRGARRYDGDGLPHGRWQLSELIGGVTVTQTFDTRQVESCRWVYDVSQRLSMLELASPAQTLSPNQHITVDQTWTIQVKP